MLLSRRSRAPLRVRVRVSSWTSVSLVGLMAALVLVVPATNTVIVQNFFLKEYTLIALDDFDTTSDTRRLGDSSYPIDDPFLTPKGEYKNATNKGWNVLHVILIGYMLLGLNTVCDIYFTGALDVMVEKWDIKPDVAGATFMAAGGSAPELFTSLIGAVITTNDVGFGTIVGSAVFNVLFVIGLCGFAAKTPIALTWWPLFRDCSYYIASLALLALFAKTGGSIEWWEAMLLFLVYIGYCTMMYFNESVQAFFDRSYRKDRAGSKVKSSQVAPLPDGPEEDEPGSCKSADGEEKLRDSAAIEAVPGPPEHHIGLTGAVEENLEKATVVAVADKMEATHIQVSPVEEGTAGGTSAEREKPATTDKDNEKGDAGSEEEGDDIEEMMIRPEGKLATFFWILKLPIFAPLYYLTPKPERRFLVCFTVSLMWIAGYSFFLVWWVEILCLCYNIDMIVAGFTVLAAGTSIPDLVSSMAVARAGQGDMAVSSSIGSNIFDILVGLPVPWMIKILLIEGLGNGEATPVSIQSPYIVMYVILLLFMVLMVMVSIHLIGWKLNKALGACMAALYAVFLLVALSVELGKPEWLKF